MTAPRFSASITTLFTARPFAERALCALRAGYDGIEIQDIRPIVTSADDCASLNDVPVALLNLDMGDLLAGGPGLSGVPGREQAFRQATLEGIALAARLGADCVNIGPSRVPPGGDRRACRDVLIENLAFACAAARGSCCRIVVEPLNAQDHLDVLLSTLDDAVAVLAEVGDGGLLFDAYHVARSGHDPVAMLAAHADHVAHIQIADAPGRGAPGSGTIDFAAFFALLAKIGYAGWIGAEYHAADPDLGWLVPARRAFET